MFPACNNLSSYFISNKKNHEHTVISQSIVQIIYLCFLHNGSTLPGYPIIRWILNWPYSAMHFCHLTKFGSYAIQVDFCFFCCVWQLNESNLAYFIYAHGWTRKLGRGDWQWRHPILQRRVWILSLVQDPLQIYGIISGKSMGNRSNCTDGAQISLWGPLSGPAQKIWVVH